MRWYKVASCYVGCAFANGAINGNRYWKKQIYPRLYLEEEEPLATREVLDRGLTMTCNALLNLAPPVFIYSMYRNAQRVEIWWRGLDPKKYKFYYDQL